MHDSGFSKKRNREIQSRSKGEITSKRFGPRISRSSNEIKEMAGREREGLALGLGSSLTAVWTSSSVYDPALTTGTETRMNAGRMDGPRSNGFRPRTHWLVGALSFTDAISPPPTLASMREFIYRERKREEEKFKKTDKRMTNMITNNPYAHLFPEKMSVRG